MSTTTTITKEQTPESLTLAYTPEIHQEVRLSMLTRKPQGLTQS